jgi:aminomethyltransferase
MNAGAVLVERPGRGLFRLSGKDPLGMLNAILTNSVPADADRGVYALLLNPKGRVQTDLRVLKAGEAILVDTEPEGIEAALGNLGRYAPFSRVRVEDLADTWSVLGLYGPKAPEILDGAELAEHQTAEVEIGDEVLLAAGVSAPASGFDLFGPRDAIVRAREALASRGAVPAGPETHETARIEAGLPRFGTDITPENFPAEAGVLERAVDFTKGCYPGQETVARMRYRGHPNKTLFRLSAASPDLAPATPILQNGDPVGTVTSVAPLTTAGETLALGYLSRKVDVEAPLNADGRVLRVLGEAG